MNVKNLTNPVARMMGLTAVVALAWAATVAGSNAHARGQVHSENQAKDLYFSIGVTGPGVAIGASNLPPPPVYYAPPPVYYSPPPVVYSPPPVYYRPPPQVVYRPPVVVYEPYPYPSSVRRPHHHHHHDNRRWDDDDHRGGRNGWRDDPIPRSHNRRSVD